MKKRAFIAISAAVFLWGQILAPSVSAGPTTQQDARRIIAGWLKADSEPLGASLGQQIGRVETFNDDSGEPAYHIVYLQPRGFVIVAADDLVEPIIGFAEAGGFDPSLANPLGALVTRDVGGRVAEARGEAAHRSAGAIAAAARARAKWDELEGLAEGIGVMGLSSISDVRVEPLVQSKWDQGTACSYWCYNYYAPNHYPCGCVATAMAQVMRYHQHPTDGIGVHTFQIEVNSTPQDANTRGGDGNGGPYSWGDMVLEPGCSNYSDARWKAIGALCYDAGVTVNMSYTSGGSSADTRDTKDALTGTFDYDNAIKAYNSGSNIGSGLNGMVNPNLDAKDPVLLGVKGASGHAVVCDGYGYNSSTLYHHLNMGWGGDDDAWYNLPSINSSPSYSSVYKCVYNIRVSAVADGEMISGRVFDPNGDIMSGVTVYAEPNGQSYWIGAQSDSKGIYAFDDLDSATNYTVNALADGYVFTSQSITTGTSADGGNTSGNVWGVDLHSDVLEITAITPSSGPAGSYVKIEGENFGASAGSVLFPCLPEGSPYGQEVQWSDTVAYCRVPKYAVSGDVKIYTAGYATSSGRYFEVTNPTELIVDINDYTANIENGTTEYPFSRIQRGINAATELDTVIVNPGTYEELVDFNGVNITLTGSDTGDANIIASTVIDGNQNGPVVTFENGEDANSVLAGFTITGGNAESGGGIYCEQSAPALSYCMIMGNYADHYGGGMYSNSCSPTLVNCMFRNNSVDWFGGGMFNQESSSPTLVNCTFSANSAGSNGGAVYNNWASCPMVINCTVSGNVAAGCGGINNSWDSNPVLSNCILWANRDNGGVDESAQIEGGTPSVNYCCIQGLTGSLGGTGNIDDDPNFTREPNDGGDGWGVGDNDEPGDLHLTGDSGCIDAGDNTAVPADTADLDGDGNTTEATPWDFDGHPRFVDDPGQTDTGNGTVPIVDMGADEFPYLGDLDFSGCVNFFDYAGLAGYWQDSSCGTCSGADLTGDGNVDANDLREFADNWLAGCGP